VETPQGAPAEMIVTDQLDEVEVTTLMVHQEIRSEATPPVVLVDPEMMTATVPVAVLAVTIVTVPVIVLEVTIATDLVAKVVVTIATDLVAKVVVMIATDLAAVLAAMIATDLVVDQVVNLAATTAMDLAVKLVGMILTVQDSSSKAAITIKLDCKPFRNNLT